MGSTGGSGFQALMGQQRYSSGGPDSFSRPKSPHPTAKGTATGCRLREHPSGPEPVANGCSLTWRLSQLEPVALPLTNQRPGVGQKCCRLMRSRQGRDGTAANQSESNGGEMELPLNNERPLGIGKSCC